MSHLNEIILPEHIHLDQYLPCCREAYSVMAKSVGAAYDLPAHMIVNALQEREKLGSTCIGEGIAIPHAKIVGLPHMVGAILRLAKPIDADAFDQAPIDLVFMLLAPVDAHASHLKALSQIARMVRDEDFKNAIRGAKSAEAVHSLIEKSSRIEIAA